LEPIVKTTRIRKREHPNRGQVNRCFFFLSCFLVFLFSRGDMPNVTQTPAAAKNEKFIHCILSVFSPPA